MKNLVIAVIVGLISTLSSSAYWTVRFTHVCPGDDIRWWSSDMYNPCPTIGNDCRMSVPVWRDDCNMVGNPAPGGGWILTGFIDQISFVGPSNQSVSSSTLEGFTILSSEYTMRVLSAESNSEYVNVTVDLGGVVVGSNGVFSVYVPPVH